MKITILLLCLILPSSTPLTAQTKTANPQSASEITKSAVKIIEERYLYTTNAAWKKARSAILAIQLGDRESVYALIAHHLATVHDSELHLVSSRDLAAINDESKGTHIGTGLIDFGIDLFPKTGEARIVTPLVGSPAAAAGLRPRDVIISVNGKPTRALDHEQVMEALRHKGDIRLAMRRGKYTWSVRLKRSNQPVIPVVSELKLTDVGTVAYLRIIQVTPDAADKVRTIVMKLEPEHPIGYILDLRNNPGGLLDSAAGVAGVFTSGTVGEKVRTNGTVEPITSEQPPLTRAPVVVLVNEGTASAAEFVGGALQDLHRAKLVGTPTFGRGQAQVYVSLSQQYGLIIPSALLRSPHGHLYKGKGLSPDVLVTGNLRREADLTTQVDRQFQRAINYLTNKHSTGSSSTSR